MMKLLTTVFLAILLLAASTAAAETPDECAARLDQTIAVTSFQEAANWWKQVERECTPDPTPAQEATYDPNKPFTGIYGWSGDFVFCVMSASLNIRNRPGGEIVGRFDKGAHFTIDLATQQLASGYVWAKHDKGWSALFPYGNSGDDLTSLTFPVSCPTPTPKPTPRPRATASSPRTSSAQHEVFQIGQTKNFTLSGAHCAMTASRGNSLTQGELYIAVGRLGWLRDSFIRLM